MTNSKYKIAIPYEEEFNLRKTESIRLVLQTAISFIILIFCMGQLLTRTTNTALYWSGITTIIAWWMPSPGEPSRKHSNVSLSADDSDVTVNANALPSNGSVSSANAEPNSVDNASVN
jgi:hypothetical protein